MCKAGRCMKKTFVSFKEFKRYCIDHNIRSQDHFRALSRPEGIPSNPNLVYDEWPGWREVTGRQKFVDFATARAYACELGLRGYMDWVAWLKKGQRPEQIPSNPYIVYRDQWRGWKYFLGIEYVGYREASKFAGETIAQLKRHWTKEGNKQLKIERPASIPLTIKYKYPKQWRGIRKFLKAGPMPLNELHEIVILHGLNRWVDYLAFHRQNKIKGMRSKPSEVYGRKWPGWKRFVRGEFK
jgi:hypothetical protein